MSWNIERLTISKATSEITALYSYENSASIFQIALFRDEVTHTHTHNLDLVFLFTWLNVENDQRFRVPYRLHDMKNKKKGGSFTRVNPIRFNAVENKEGIMHSWFPRGTPARPPLKRARLRIRPPAFLPADSLVNQSDRGIPLWIPLLGSPASYLVCCQKRRRAAPLMPA